MNAPRVLILALSLTGLGPGLLASAPEATPLQVALHKVQQEAAVAELLHILQTKAPHGLVVIRNVKVVDPVTETVTPGQSVIVSEGRIGWVGDVAKEPKVEDLKLVDGAGRFASPGLTDAHVHAGPADGWLLDLAYGVTSVRDMAGFPWMLKARQQINSGRMLAPVDYVAGPLINGFALEGYAVVPANSQDARRLVRQQAACGYDFVKVHNIVPLPIFDAVAAQARTLGMDLIGHVPHDIAVRHAVEAGMRTMEHLKGFLNDRTLKAGETDFAAAVDGPDVWNVPTLYAGRGYASGDSARALMASPEMRYVPLRKREKWASSINGPEDPASRAGREAGVLMKGIVGELHRVHAKFLAGTDADNYPFQVMGSALVEEIGLLHDAGLTAPEALRAATSEAARALRQAEEFGQIKRGMRSDVVLLDSNPLIDATAYRTNRGVMAHGYWLDRAALDSALDRLAAVNGEHDSAAETTQAAVTATLSRIQTAIDDGFVFSAPRLSALAAALRKSGSAELAGRFEALADVPTVGPCADGRFN